MNSVPNLRFKEFSGEWESQPLSKLGTFFKGTGLSKADLSDEGNPCVLYGELYTKYTEVIANVKSKTNVELGNAVIGKINDVLIPSSGETAVDIATASCLQQDDVILGGDLNVFRSNQVNGIFTSYQLNTSKKFEIAKLAQGASVVHVYNDQLKKLKLSVPTIEEQEKIASFFSLIDKKIELQTEKVEELKNYKKGIMQKIFSQELRFKDENGNEYPEWEEKKLGEMGTCTSGVGFSDKYQGYLNLPIKVFKVSDMNIHGNHKFMVNANNTVSDELLKQMKTKSIKSPSIIFAKVGAAIFLERKRIVNSEFLIDNNMMAFIPNSSNDIEFMYYLLSGIRLSRYAQVGALPSYNASDISYIKVRIPCLKEQVKIAKVLSKIDEKIEIEQEKLNYLIQYKKGLLQQMFI